MRERVCTFKRTRVGDLFPANECEVDKHSPRDSLKSCESRRHTFTLPEMTHGARKIMAIRGNT